MADIVQTHLMDLQFDGMYRSWSLLKTRLVIDELSLPLVESNFAHFVALEVCYTFLTNLQVIFLLF